MEKPRAELVVAEAGYTEAMLSGFRKALKKFGLHVYSHPAAAGGDTHVLMVTDQQLDSAGVRKLAKTFEPA